jgi:hypothetical protein
MAKEVVSGTHKTGKNNWDGMHKFASQDATWAGLHGWAQFGPNAGSGKVGKALVNFYKTYKLNPCITSVKLTVDPVKFTVDYEFTIEESPDGNAYVGMSSWGGASGGYPTKKPPGSWAYSNYKKEYDGAKKNHKNTIIKDIIDFYFPGGFRQIFFQYTHPTKYPNLSKSPGLREGTVGVKIGPAGSPTGLPEYNGILVETVVYDGGPQPSGLSASNTGSSASNTEEVTKVKNDNLINGKIIITKKSGPGELTGINEAELVQVRNLDITNAQFGVSGKELQFTEPGDYVLSITCTDDRIEPYELKVKVTKEDEFIAQPESKGKEPEKPPVDGTRPIISQIDKPTIVVPAIKMDKDKTSPDQDSYTKGMGYTPLIWYKAYAFEDRSIKSMRLYHDGLIPMIEFTFEDTKELLKSEATPQDDATIDLFLNSSSKNLKSIHMVFKIKGFVQGNPQAGQTYNVTGSANIPSLYVQNNKTYQGTSFEALRQICKELEIGFNSNIKDTNDSMSWRNTNKKPYEFMDEIISRSYINDESYMAGYIDYYYCFNYVDLEKEMNRDASKDLGINTSAMSEQSKSEESERLIGLRLTNEQSQNSSSNFIGSYTALNESTKKSLQNGYATITKTYDRIKKQFLVFTVDSTTSDGTETYILKGGKHDDKYQKENVRHKFLGKIDTDNVHADYNYAVTQNRINLNNLNKIVLNVTLPNANWNLYKFMKIGVDLINASSTPTNPSVRDHRYSGYYIIADIEYIWNGTSMSQKLRLVKKELGKTPEEVRNDPPPQKKPEVKENNENPVGTTASTLIPAPNTVYNVGQTYLVQDKSGKLYNLTVTSLLENGIEVTGTLKESPIGMSSSTTSNTVATTPLTENTSGTPSVAGMTPSIAAVKPFENAADIKKFQDWLDATYPTWLKNGKLNKGSGYGNYGTNTQNAYKAYGDIYNNYLKTPKGMSASTS